MSQKLNLLCSRDGTYNKEVCKPKATNSFTEYQPTVLLKLILLL